MSTFWSQKLTFNDEFFFGSAQLISPLFSLIRFFEWGAHQFSKHKNDHLPTIIISIIYFVRKMLPVNWFSRAVRDNFESKSKTDDLLRDASWTGVDIVMLLLCISCGHENRNYFLSFRFPFVSMRNDWPRCVFMYMCSVYAYTVGILTMIVNRSDRMCMEGWKFRFE